MEATFTDLYQLTMAQAYWKKRHTQTATFSLFFRNYPTNRAYFVAAGIEAALHYLDRFRFSEEEIANLRSLNMFEDRFLHTLSNLRFTGSVRAVREGTIVFANEPVIEVTSSLLEAQLFETALINIINIHTILATKASRVVWAAHSKPVYDFGARRAHGQDAADTFAKVAWMVGFHGTSNVEAALKYHIPAVGTMAHSFIMSYPTELEAFRAYASVFPENVVLLVDTYEVERGVQNAIALQAEGYKVRAIRIDSGDLKELAIQARSLLDAAGMTGTKIILSGGLDEYDLIGLHPYADVFGVGTKVITSADAPWTDAAYKLVEYGLSPVVKKSAKKATYPHKKQVYREVDEYGRFKKDTLTSGMLYEPNGLLHVRMTEGRHIGGPEGLEASRSWFQQQFAVLPNKYKMLQPTEEYPVEVDADLQKAYEEAAANAG